MTKLQSAKLGVDPPSTISMLRCMDQFYKLLKNKNYRFLLLYIILIEIYSNYSKENILMPFIGSQGQFKIQAFRCLVTPSLDKIQ